MTKSFWIYGKHSVLAAIKNKKRIVKKILCTDNFDISQIENHNNLEIVSKKTIKKKLNLSDFHEQNICAEIFSLNNSNLEEIVDKKCSIILDKITDTRNLGSIFRTAVAFNINDIIVHERSFNDTSKTMYKAASGAMEHINIYKVKNIVNAMKFLKKNNFWIYGMDVKANIEVNKSTTFDKKITFILGSEEKGISNIVKKNCDELIKIKINNEIESLNVSNSLAAILMSYSILKL
ncbi:RNA methyltransferase [Pelagibacteraceae bacterium]|nr:RNA methyltransferase [Pelagibacteraceae bacterium]